MVELSVQDGILLLSVQGLHKLWAFKKSLQVPLAAIERVRTDPEGTTNPEGTRNPGTHIPGLIIAGTFNDGLKRVFWDVHNREKVIVITLKSGRYDVLTILNDHYDELVVEVADPDGAVQYIHDNIKGEQHRVNAF